MTDKPLHPAQKKLPVLPNVSVTACWFELTHGEAISCYPYRITEARDENPKVHYLKFIGPYHPDELPENVSTPGDIYIVSTPGNEACYGRTNKGQWWLWDIGAPQFSQLSMLYHPSCHPLHLRYLWSDGRVVGWYSRDHINEARHHMTKGGLFDTNDTSKTCAPKIVRALLAHHDAKSVAKRPREQEEAFQASHPAKKSNTGLSPAHELSASPLISPPRPEKVSFFTAGKSTARSDTETDASSELPAWKAERETLLKKILDLNSELEKLRANNTASTTPTEAPEKTSSNSTLSDRILGFLAESMLDPRTLKTLGLGE